MVACSLFEISVHFSSIRLSAWGWHRSLFGAFSVNDRRPLPGSERWLATSSGVVMSINLGLGKQPPYGAYMDVDAKGERLQGVGREREGHETKDIPTYSPKKYVESNIAIVH